VQSGKKLSLLPASADLLLGLLFYPEDGGDILLGNIRLSPIYMTIQPRRH
jgi:hypothetical protein